MKVFISWSGPTSKRLADVFRRWLPGVLQLVKPYFTPSDIEKGARWTAEISKELETSEVGIICLTRENLQSDWIMFESGALSKTLDKSHVCPMLFGIQNTDLAGPLQQFQTTEFEKDDVRKLVSLINSRLGEHKLTPQVLDIVFEKWWPELESQVMDIIDEVNQDDAEPIRSDRELLVELLERSRSIERRMHRTLLRINPEAMRDLLQRYIALHDGQVAGIGGYQDTLDQLKAMRQALIYMARHFRGMDSDLDELISKIDSLDFLYEDDVQGQDEVVPF